MRIIDCRGGAELTDSGIVRVAKKSGDDFTVWLYSGYRVEITPDDVEKIDGLSAILPSPIK